MHIYQQPTVNRFSEVKRQLTNDLLKTTPINRTKWQQLNVAYSALHHTHELRDVVVHFDRVTPSIDQLVADLNPDVPWAEDHFHERVSGEPMNPGEAHAYWPYHGASIREHLRNMGTAGAHYDHNYMERLWCRKLTMGNLDLEWEPPFTGYRFEVGDLGSVVTLLNEEPTTRQAYVPIWFPEDTGATSGQRVPCTLGYYFQITGGRLHMTYNLRACELYRHFTNDVYLAIRLQQWMASQLEEDVALGEFTMNVANMHLFLGDVPKVRA